MEIEDTTEKGKEEKEKSLMDTLSERLITLKNSERKFIGWVSQHRESLELSQADLIAVRARIDEIQKLINEQSESGSEKP